MPLARRFAFLAAGCPENEGARNSRVVAHSFFGLVCMTCGAWPPCHKVGSSVHAGGDFTRDASGARVGGSAFKKGSISRAVDMPRSSCDLRALSPSGPPDGVRRCSLEGSTSRSFLPATSPLESARSWWCRRSCPLLAAVGGVQPHGSWHPSTIIRLQGFSSCSPTAAPRRWSSRRMTTSLVVGRSKPGCGLSPPLNFKDAHHPCWGGGCAELGPHLCVGSSPLLPSVLGGEGHQLFMRRRRTSGTRGWPTTGVASHRVPDALAWMALAPPPTLPPAAGSGRGCPFTARATPVGHTYGFSRATDRTGGSYMASYVAGVAAVFLDVLTPLAKTGARTFKRAEAAVAQQGWLSSPGLQLFGFNGLVDAPRMKAGARTFPQRRTC
jgi:hypothetical protein